MAAHNEAIAIGQRKADEVLARRKIARARRAKALEERPQKLEFRVQTLRMTEPVATATVQTAGFLAAAGDSWFDYPLHDVLKLLEDDFGYNVESAAHRGDPLEAMAYQGGQLDKFARCLEKITAQGASPKAVLLSGGGDDIAGPEFGMLLNNATSAIAGWNGDVLAGVINERIATAMKAMLSAMTSLCRQDLGKAVPILVHGYDYPVPDGRGFLGGWPFPGPWLEPGFHEKLFTNLPKTTALMHEIIDRFNKMVVDVARDPALANVHYIDLRGTLSNDLVSDAYKKWWANELHPTDDGFTRVAAKFAAVIEKL